MLRRRSMTIHGHRTSITLEPEFWEALQDLAHQQHMSLAGLVSQIDQGRTPDTNLSSALRVYTLKSCRRLPE